MAKRYAFEIQSALSKESIEDARQRNLNWAKNHLLKTGRFETSMWIYTDGTGSEPQNVYYILTNPEISKDQNESPKNQIEPILLTFKNKPDEFGSVMAYQVISETWVKSFSKIDEMPPLKHGDIANMPNRDEWFLEQYVKRGFDLKTTAFEIVRENTDEVKDLILIKDINKMQSEKLPPL